MEQSLEHMSREELISLLYTRDRETEEIVNSVPCAVMRLQADECGDGSMKLLRFSNGLCGISGYSRQELCEELGGDYQRLILSEDRHSVWQAAREQGGCGGETRELKYRLRRKDGRVIWILDRWTYTRREDGSLVYNDIILDIDAEQRAKQRLQTLAERDSLTGVYNRGAAMQLMEAAIAQVGPEHPCALLVLDLDEFKLINDTMGHQQGDALLAQFAGVLGGTFRRDDIIGRIGGDEFCVLMGGVTGRPAVERKLAELQCALGAVFSRNDPVRGSCSIGAALAPEDGRDFEALFGRADRALYLAKKSGKGRAVFFPSGLECSPGPSQ